MNVGADRFVFEARRKPESVAVEDQFRLQMSIYGQINTKSTTPIS